MWDIIGRKNWYFLFSFLLIIPGVISLFLYGLRLSIDFTGGSRITLLFNKPVSQVQVAEVRKTFEKQKIEISTIQTSQKEVFVRTKPLSEKQDTVLLTELNKNKKVGDFKQEQFETIGPTIGKEITLNALKAIAIGSVLIMFYIAWSFRKVPKPASSWRFGITTIITLLHDVLVLLGVFSILGHFFYVEVDTLFLTALLTVMGFSVHDTIVVFDRIRENLLRNPGRDFAQIVNDSILQTLSRSLNTSLTAMLVLLTLLLFGGETLRWFIVALLIGIASGTYSSIFNAAPLLVLWQEIDEKRRKSSTG
ncbi:MAG: protein translocase subunit SecF [Candidatus Levybacteria bacterium]|nr:protein translocase subunit SecF [Candidatus Levybacteria bacterium]